MPESLPNFKARLPRSLSGNAEAASANDMALLADIQSGRQEAMASFFDCYSKIVYSVAFRVLRDSGEAEDVMQEIFIRIWQNPRAFVPGRGSLAGWLTVIARNRAIDRLRKRRPTDPVELFALPSANDLAQESERDILLEKVQPVVANLPPEQRKCLELSFFDGLSHSEIAEQTGEPLGTVKTRIRLALIAIRKGLKI